MMSDDGTRDIINNLRIASPCPMLWSDMQRTPEEAVRFCGDCRKSVYDVSKMSAQETALLLQKAEISGASTCMQLYRRADGTVITDDCPVGLRRIRDGFRKMRSAAAGFVVFLCAQSSFAQGKDSSTESKPTPTRGRVAVPVGGAIAPSSIPLGGAPVPMNWRTEAMKNASVKNLADKIAAKEKQLPATDADKLETLQLRYNMAQEANKQGIPYFALQELGSIQTALQTKSENSGGKAEDSAKRTRLLKDVLNAKMATSKKLGVTDTKCIQDELDKLQ
jgi:hypothetical protein